MGIKQRIEKLEQRQGGNTEIRVIVCWHMEGEECDCGEGDNVIAHIRPEDWEAI